ncbi:MAG: DUF1559 domain-containing protein [Maioricimonas sp. JB049]
MSTRSSATCGSGSRNGLSLIEVLVVLGILGLLVALLLPAVQAGREAARRTQCRSNLHQLMVAFNVYQSAHELYPGGVEMYTNQILPLLEQQPGANRSPILACPSDPLEPDGSIDRSRFSYPMNDGLGSHSYPGIRDGGPRVSDRDVTDGTSNTAAFSEKLALPTFSGQLVDWDDHTDIWNRVQRRLHGAPATLEEYFDLCNTQAGRPLAAWLLWTDYNHIMTPNDNNCTLVPSPDNQGLTFYEAVTSSSAHSGGVHVAFADGAVRFVSDSVDRKVWWAVGTRSNGDIKAIEIFQ